MKPEWAGLRMDSDSIDLSDDSLEIVTFYVQWLYHEKLPIELSGTEDDIDAESHKADRDTYMLLATAYVFWEKIMDAKFKNMLVSTFIEATQVLNSVPNAQAINLVYTGTISGSPVRRLLSDLVARNASSHPSWPAFFDELLQEAVLDAIKAMAVLLSARKKGMKTLLAKDYIEDDVERGG
jgi:hypothetical protein